MNYNNIHVVQKFELSAEATFLASKKRQLKKLKKLKEKTTML